MSMMAYRATIFMVLFNYGMIIANYISTLVFPDTSVQVGVWNGTILQNVELFKNFGSIDTLATLTLTAGVLALFAFSLLIPTIPFVSLFFALSGVITEVYVWQLPLPAVFLAPISMGIAIVYYVGITQYAARSTFQGS